MSKVKNGDKVTNESEGRLQIAELLIQIKSK